MMTTDERPTGAGGCRMAASVLPVIIRNDKFPA